MVVKIGLYSRGRTLIVKINEDYKIVNLIIEDYNKAIVLYNANGSRIKEVYTKFINWLENNKESDLYSIIKKTETGNPIVRLNMATIDILLDDDWFSESDIIKVFEEF